METIQFILKPASRSVMQGSLAVPFSELVESNVAAHGEEYTRRYYTERGMSPWEVNFWVSAAVQRLTLAPCTAKQFIEALESVQAKRHNVDGWNVEFFGAKPAKVGEDY